VLFRSIKGIKIDFALNKAIVLDWNMQGNLCALDLDTKDTIQLPLYVYDDCTFGYDKNNHYAYIGGRENYVDHFYKIEIKENSMHIKDKFSNLSSHDIKSILLNSEANKIILQQENAYLYDLDDFGNQLGEIGEAWPKNIHYSSDERKIIIAGDTDNHFSVYNSSTYELEKQYLLLYPDYNNIICTMPIMFSNKVMFIMENYHDDTSRIVFYQY